MYSQLSFNGHLTKTDTQRVDGHIVLVPKVSVLKGVDCILNLKLDCHDASVILLPLCPASLVHKKRQRHKLMHCMHPVERKDRSIDLKMFL